MIKMKIDGKVRRVRCGCDYPNAIPNIMCSWSIAKEYAERRNLEVRCTGLLVICPKCNLYPWYMQRKDTKNTRDYIIEEDIK
jgi:hypothetical protein